MQQFLEKPSIDFGAVRDGRRSMPLWLDIDLTNARSIAGGNALSINIAGNSFYVDADTVNVGIATLHFQDTNLGNASAPFIAAPGFVANVAFTQILVENAAQAGKRLRIFYGVDLDFRAGVNASVISGTVSVSGGINPRPEAGSIAYADMTLYAANVAQLVVAAATNVNGLLVTQGNLWTGNATTVSICSLLAKATAPANIADGRVIFASENFGGGAYSAGGSLKKDIYVPAGLGLYFITNVAESAGLHSCAYKVL